MPPPGFHSSAFQDDLSTCSSPIPWPPKPVPAPSFEIPSVEVKDLTWEHCTSILHEPPRKSFLALCGSDRGSSKSERFTPNVVGSPEFEPPKDGLFSLPESECPRSPTAVSSVSYGSQSFRDVDSIPPLPREPSGSLLKRIFRPLGKSRLSRSCKPPSPGKRTKSPPARLSCADLGFDADPRVSSTNVISDAGGLMDVTETGDYASDRLARWLHDQQWQAMVCKAQSHLNELQSLLNLVVRSMNDLREVDEYAKEVRQKQTRCYFAS